MTFDDVTSILKMGTRALLLKLSQFGRQLRKCGGGVNSSGFFLMVNPKPGRSPKTTAYDDDPSL